MTNVNRTFCISIPFFIRHLLTRADETFRIHEVRYEYKDVDINWLISSRIHYSLFYTMIIDNQRSQPISNLDEKYVNLIHSISQTDSRRFYCGVHQISRKEKLII